LSAFINDYQQQQQQQAHVNNNTAHELQQQADKNYDFPFTRRRQN